MHKIKKNKIIVESDEESFSRSEQKSPEYSCSEFEKQHNLLLEKLTKNYKQHKEELKNLMKLYKKEIKTCRKNKKNTTKRDKTGFTKPSRVPDKLIKLFNLKKGTEISRVELTKKFYDMMEAKNLYYQKDKRVFRADKELREVFNLPESVNKCTDPKDTTGFNFYNLQKHLAQCYNESKVEKSNYI